MVELVNSNWDEFIENLFNNDFVKEFLPELHNNYESFVQKYNLEDDLIKFFPLPLLITNNEGEIVQINNEFHSFIEGRNIENFIRKNITEFCKFEDDLNKIDFQNKFFSTLILRFNFLEYPKNLEQKTFLHLFLKEGETFIIWVVLFKNSDIGKYFQNYRTFEEFKQIFESLPYVIYIKDTYNRILRVNKQFCKKFQKNPEEVEGKFVDSLFSEEVVNTCKEKDLEVIKTGNPITGSEEKFEINGKIENYFIVDRIPLFHNNEISGILVFAFDITEKKKTEIELRRWKKRFDFATTATGQAVFERNWESGEVVWTDNIKDLFGYSKKELNKREKWIEKIVSSDLDNYLTTFQKHCENLSPYDLTYRIKTSEGTIRYVKESGFFLTDEGKIISIVGIISDVTDQKNLEQKVVDYTTFLHVLLDTIPMPIFYEDIEGKFIGCNKYFQEHILHLGKKEFFGKTVKDFPNIFNESFIAKHLDANRKIIQNEKVESYDEKISLADGIVKSFAIFKAGYKDFDGELAGIINILIDVTDRIEAENQLRNLNIELEKKIEERTRDLQTALEEYKFEVEEHRRVQEILEQANYELKILNETIAEESRKLIVLNEKLEKSERELREANSAKDKFFSIIAHDLRNPLQSILTDSEILDKFFDTFTPEKIREYVNHIYKTSTLLKNLLENLLTWAKTQTGRIVYRPEWININLLITDIVRYIEPTAKNKGISLIYNKDMDFMVYLDRNMITTVIRNLLSNAIKFSPRNSNVYIDIQNYYEGNIPSLKVSVRDEGIGISKDIQEKLFKIEYSISTAGTEKEQGTGLGLILCYELIKLHNGKIWFESEEGKGTTFTFVIPINFD